MRIIKILKTSAVWDRYRDEPERSTQFTNGLPQYLQDRVDAEELSREINILKDLRTKEKEAGSIWRRMPYGDPDRSAKYSIYEQLQQERLEQRIKVEDMIRQNDIDASYSTSNPDQSEVYSGDQLPMVPLKEKLAHDWARGATSRYGWYALISDVYGFDLADLMKKTAYEKNGAVFSIFPTMQHGANNVEDFKKMVDKTVGLWGDMKPHDEFKSSVNPGAAKSAMKQIQQEAAEMLNGKPLKVYRGMPVSKKLYESITNSIREKGYIDLLTMPVSSFTSDLRLAKSFGKYGEGGRQRSKNKNDGFGIVFSQTATPENIWMHYQQPSFQNATLNNTYHIGKTSQKEIVLGFPTGIMRVTKDDLIVPKF